MILVGRDTFMRSLDCLRPRGLMVSFGNASGPVEPFSPVLLSQKGSLFLTRPTLFITSPRASELERRAGELFEMVASGKVKIEVQAALPAQAMRPRRTARWRRARRRVRPS